MHWQTAHAFQVRTLECITWQLCQDITEAKTTIGIARLQQGKTKKVPGPHPRININHEQLQERTAKAIEQRQSLIQVQELYKKNSGWKTAPNAQTESELSFRFAKEVTDSGELLAAVPDMVHDYLDIHHRLQMVLSLPYIKNIWPFYVHVCRVVSRPMCMRMA